MRQATYEEAFSRPSGCNWQPTLAPVGGDAGRLVRLDLPGLPVNPYQPGDTGHLACASIKRAGDGRLFTYCVYYNPRVGTTYDYWVAESAEEEAALLQVGAELQRERDAQMSTQDRLLSSPGMNSEQDDF